MLRNLVSKMDERMDEFLRNLCGRITPEKRLAVLLIMFISFGLLSISVMVYSIYSIGKNDGRLLEIEHLEQLRIKQKQGVAEDDSIPDIKFEQFKFKK